jgi:hypothetical protein
MASLKIFLSYAKEDEPFATAIGQRLSSIFKQSVDVSYMQRFTPGINWRKRIDEAVDGADILLVIATGRQKPSHSFTGYEVGYFRKSQESRKFVDDQHGVERLIIPFSIFTGIPPTLEEIQGLLVETDRLEYDVEAAEKPGGNTRAPFLRLLERIDGILDKLAGAAPRFSELESKHREFIEQAQLFHSDVDSFMRSLPVSSEFPKPRLTLRLPADSTPKGVKIDDSVLVSCSGPTAGIFELDQSEQSVPWSAFSKRIGSPHIALVWNDALRSLASSTLEGNFADTGQLVFSYDEKKLFHLFLSETRRYYDRTRQLEVYLVEILHDKDIGDPKTTFLAKMISISMAYRSLFFETGGPYSNNAIILLTEKDKWKSTINDMLRDMRLLYTRSREAGAFDPEWINEIYGHDADAIARVKKMKVELAEQLEKLNNMASEVLAESDPSQAKFDAFAKALSEFRAGTNERDTQFLVKVLEHLKRIVTSGAINLELAGDMEGPTEILLDGAKVNETSARAAALISLPSGQHALEVRGTRGGKPVSHLVTIEPGVGAELRLTVH